MAWLKTHLKTLFSNKTLKNPSRSSKKSGLEKGKQRALNPDYDPSTNLTSSSSASVSDSDLLPIIHYSEISQVPELLTRFPAFYLVGHPLPPPPFARAKQILTLPDEEKRRLIHPRGSTVRGYNQAQGSGREWWDYSWEKGGEFLTIQDDEEFKRETKEYFEGGIKILQEICAEFNKISEMEDRGVVVPETVMEGVGFSTMRYLRYCGDLIPKEAVEGSGSSSPRRKEIVREKPKEYELPRMEAHTDHGILTLMTSTEPSGLYVWDRHGRIFSAPPIENCVLVIAGDLMAHFTGAERRSPLEGANAIGEKTVLPTVHAVVIPKEKGERISVAVFLRPERDLVVSKRTIKEVVDGQEREVQDEMSFGRWAEEKGKFQGRRCWMVGQEKLGASIRMGIE